MYSVMIVDDEPLMVKYLKNNVGKIAPEWQVSGIAPDGLQAVELLERQSFDLVITDIRMPEMDGLELAKFISEIYPQTRVVIISGFDDFDYARRAIRCGVSDYLLKPLSDENISGTLKEIAEQLRAARAKSFSEDVLAKAAALPPSEIRSLFLHAVLYQDNADIRAVYSVMAGRQMELLRQPYSCVGVLGVDAAALLSSGKDYREIASHQMRLNQLCREVCRDDPNSAVCYCADDTTAVLLCSQEAEAAAKRAEEVCGEVRRRMERDGFVRVLGTCGPAEKDILCLQNSYQAASQNFMLTFFTEPPASGEDMTKRKKSVCDFTALESSVYSDYISNHDAGIHNALTGFFERLPEGGDGLLSARFGLCLLGLIARRGRVRKKRLEKAFRQLASSWNDACRKADPKEVAEAFYRAIFALNKDEVPPYPGDNNQLVDGAKNYIAAHYSEPISLTLIAEKLGVSSSYLSDLFHREVGEPYSKFITRVRMEQAILRMKSDPNKKIRTLAAEVGFINAKHFNSVFKKFYHVTPTEYFKTFL